MKRFLKSITIFGIVLWGLLIIEDVITTCAFNKLTTRKYGVWNEILHTEIHADMLVMGNSRAWRQYSPQILDSILGTNTYNIGIDGSCFDRQFARYEIYRHYQNATPKIIIQNVEFFTLDHTEGYEREQFMPYLMYPYFRKRMSSIEPFNFGEMYIPMYRYYVNNFYDEYTKYDFPINKGYLGNELRWDTKSKKVEPYIQVVDTNTLQMFIKYIEDTQHEGIQLVFVLAPLYYNDVTRIVLNLNEIHGLYYELSEKYNIPMLDYANCWTFQDTRYFYNATHLNILGAELFSTKLAHDIDSLGIIKY